MARGFAAADRPGALRGGGAADAPLVRRPRDAPPLHDRRREGLLRRALSGEPFLPRRRGARLDRLRRVRHRPLPLDLPARAEHVPSGHRADRQRERQRRPSRGAVRGDDRDADAGAVRPPHPRHRRRPALRRPRPADHGPPPSRPRRRSHAQLRRQARSALELPLLQGRARLRGGAGDRLGSRPGARLHALLRAHRALPGPGRVPVRGQPPRARTGAAPVHRELPLEARAGNALHARRSPQRGGGRHPAQRGLLLVSSRQRVRRRRARRGRPLRLRRPRHRRGPVPPAAAGRQADRQGRADALPPRPPAGFGQPRTTVRRGPRAAADQLRALQRAALPLRLGALLRAQRLPRADREARHRASHDGLVRRAGSLPG